MRDMLDQVSACRHRIITTTAAAVVMVLAAFGASAQNTVVVVVNGDPITNLDIDYRSRFLTLANQGKPPTRQAVIDELIDERIKLQLIKRFDFSSFNIDADVENAVNNIARRRHMNQAQFAQELSSHGVPISTLKSRIRADIIWTQVIRGKFSSSLQLNDSEVLKELETRNKEDAGGYDYVLRPIMFVVPRGSPPAILEARRRDAEALRARFQNCEEGIPFARTTHAVVRDQVTRSSADLAPALRDILDKTEVGRLTPPETTSQGVEFYALCAKKPSSKDNSPGKREVRDEFYAKQFQINSQKFIKELRDQAYIVYK
jgi:peptidyl-prolyl cis-trans isomerase SurA